MTAAALPRTAPSASRPFLFAPGIDALLGCGGLYLAFLALLSVGGVDLSETTGIARPLLLLVFSVPHYGATLQRVYEQRSERRRYAFFTVWSTLAVVAVWAGALYSTLAASALVTLYLTWSPWHYTGQNYGVTTMLLRRAGVEVQAGLRRLLHASFTLSFLVVALVMHGPIAARTGYADAGGFAARFGFVPLGLPVGFMRIAIPVVLVAMAGCLAGALFLLLRRASLRQIGAPLLLIFTQAMWFTVPFGLAHFGVITGETFFDLDRRDQFFVFIAGAHAIQYLWVTSYFARSSPGWSGFGGYWLKAMLFGQLAWTIPTVLVGASGITSLRYDGGLFLLTASAVNVHHFILDGAIWKLRSSRIASVLLRGSPAPEEAAALDRGGSPWPRRLLWTVAGTALAIAVLELTAGFVFQSAMKHRNPELAAQALAPLHWLGLERTQARVQLAQLYALTDHPEQALVEAEQVLAVAESPDTYQLMGNVRAARKEWALALEAFERGLALAPERLDLERAAGHAAAQAGDWPAARRHLGQLVRAGVADPVDAAAYAGASRAMAQQAGD